MKRVIFKYRSRGAGCVGSPASRHYPLRRRGASSFICREDTRRPSAARRGAFNQSFIFREINAMEPPHLKWMLGEARSVWSLNQNPPALSTSIRPKWEREKKKKRAGAGAGGGEGLKMGWWGRGWSRQTARKGHPVSLWLFLLEMRFSWKVSGGEKRINLRYYINAPLTLELHH